MQHLKPFIGSEVFVIMSDDLTLGGTLRDVHKDGIILSKVTAISGRGEAIDEAAVDGMVVIGYFSIQWVQVPD